jgi:hypothetical protein
VLAVQHGVTEDIYAEFTGIRLADVLDKHLPHLGILGRAGFSFVLVAYEIERHVYTPV